MTLIETFAMSIALFCYRLLACLLLPVLVLRFLCKAVKQRDYLTHFAQRFGLLPTSQVDIWMHAVSVGEVRVAMTLLDRLRSLRPQVRFLLTTTTPTGKAVLKPLLQEAFIEHAYCPFDTYGCMKRLFVRKRPHLLLIIETEMWPNMLSVARQFDCPAVLVNGRLSQKSFSRYHAWWVRTFSRFVFNQLTLLLAQSHADIQRYRALGFTGDILDCGNIKFDMTNAPREQAQRQDANRLVWLALSVRDGEVMHIIDAVNRIKNTVENSQCVIVPRHLHLVVQITKNAKRNQLSCVVVQTPAQIMHYKHADIVVINAMGIVAQTLALIDYVFVGGSLAPHGGQNMLEPIAHAKPVCIGTHYFNFQTIVDGLRTENAIAVVDSSEALARLLVHWHQCYQEAALLVSNAQRFYAVNQGATQRSCQALAGLLTDDSDAQ